MYLPLTLELVKTGNNVTINNIKVLIIINMLNELLTENDFRGRRYSCLILHEKVSVFVLISI